MFLTDLFTFLRVFRRCQNYSLEGLVHILDFILQRVVFHPLLF